MRGRIWTAIRKVVVVVCAGAFLAACTAGNTRLAVTQRPTVGSKVVLMPLDIELSERMASGLEEPKAEWTDNAKRHIQTALDKDSVVRGLTFVKLAEPKEGTPEEDQFQQLEALHGVVGRSILIHEFFDMAKLPNKAGTFDWTLGDGAAKLAEAYDSEYALFFYVRDSYASAGRAALIVVGALLGVGVQGGVQVGFASLVDLKTGNVVWFNRLIRGVGDLRTEDKAEETVKTLMTGFPK